MWGGCMCEGVVCVCAGVCVHVWGCVYGCQCCVQGCVGCVCVCAGVGVCAGVCVWRTWRQIWSHRPQGVRVPVSTPQHPASPESEGRAPAGDQESWCCGSGSEAVCWHSPLAKGRSGFCSVQAISGWMRSTHIVENLLCSKPNDLNVKTIPKHPCRHTQNV